MTDLFLYRYIVTGILAWIIWAIISSIHMSLQFKRFISPIFVYECTILIDIKSKIKGKRAKDILFNKLCLILWPFGLIRNAIRLDNALDFVKSSK